MASHCVLIVDDEPSLRMLVGSALEQALPECMVLQARDGVEACEVIDRHLPNLVLLDLNMPRMDGFELCRAIRSRNDCGGVTVIAMTGYATPENAARILQCGASHCVSKPFAIPSLIEKVRAVLSGVSAS